METILDILNSPLIHIDDQIELAVRAWENYHQFGSELPGYVYYDIWDLIGPSIQHTYATNPEYTDTMAATETRRIIMSMAHKLYTVVQILASRLDEAILPALDVEHYIGVVRSIGGDLAVRIDHVEYTRNK